MVKTGTSKAALSASGWSYVEAKPSRATISSSNGYVKNASCTGTSGNGVTTSSLKVTLQWEIAFTTAQSCSIGFPSGVSCTFSGTTMTLKYSKTCSNTSTCNYDFANQFYIYPQGSSTVKNVKFQVSVTGKQSGKSAVSGNTTAAIWYI